MSIFNVADRVKKSSLSTKDESLARLQGITDALALAVVNTVLSPEIKRVIASKIDQSNLKRYGFFQPAKEHTPAGKLDIDLTAVKNSLEAKAQQKNSNNHRVEEEKLPIAHYRAKKVT